MPPGGGRTCLLAIGTSTDWCTVALLLRDASDIKVSTREMQAGPLQSTTLMPMIKALFVQAGLTLDALDAVAFDAGPGAFTGLRIGCGTAQGLGFALDVPLLPVGSLEALALQCRGEHVCCVIDARMGEVYTAGYRRADGIPVATGPVRAASANDPMALLAEWTQTAGVDLQSGVATGDAFIRHPALVNEFERAGMRVQPVAFPGAEAIARIALGRFDAGQGLNARDAAPVYVRDKVALDVDEQQRLRAARAGVAGGAR